jgi:hypothetical protein
MDREIPQKHGFTLYALKTDRVDVPEKISFDAFTKAVAPHVLATARLVGTFAKVRRSDPFRGTTGGSSGRMKEPRSGTATGLTSG